MLSPVRAFEPASTGSTAAEACVASGVMGRPLAGAALRVDRVALRCGGGGGAVNGSTAGERTGDSDVAGRVSKAGMRNGDNAAEEGWGCCIAGGLAKSCMSC